MYCNFYECKYNDHGMCMAYREEDEKCSCETKVKAPMLRFMLDGCDISFVAEAPADMTLAQLLKQCDKIHPNWCACGIKTADESDRTELIFGYDSIKIAKGQRPSCTIDGANSAECPNCKYLKETDEPYVYRCRNEKSTWNGCTRSLYDWCDLWEDKDA